MMDYDAFCRAVHYAVEKALPEGYCVKACSKGKNNGKEKHGLEIKKCGSAFSSVVYLEKPFEEYQEGGTFDEVINDIVETALSSSDNPPVSPEKVFDFSWAKPHILFKLVNAERNKERLKAIPHKQFLDLAIVYYAMFDMPDHQQGSMEITNVLMRAWGITLEELDAVAMKNSLKKNPARVFAIRDFISNMFNTPDNILDDEDTEVTQEDVYACTNPDKLYGASAILHKGMLQRFALMAGCDVYILPSSVHEVILVPVSFPVDARDLYEMVREVNRQAVSEEDFLSDNVYRYLLVEDRIELA